MLSECMHDTSGYEENWLFEKNAVINKGTGRIKKCGCIFLDLHLDNSTAFAKLNWFHEIFASYEIKNLFFHTRISTCFFTCMLCKYLSIYIVSKYACIEKF